MSDLVRTLGFTNTIQRLVWPNGNNIPVSAYLWGGGGGGGGDDAFPGGTGSGGGFVKVDFTVSQGDVIDVAVGGGGESGRTTPQVGGAPGGSPGPSYNAITAFDTRSATTFPAVITATNSAYVSFLNQYGVWTNPISARDFDRVYSVNFPVTGTYTFTASCDDFGAIFLDGVAILDVPGFSTTYSTNIEVSAGTKLVRIVGVNTGGPGAVALTITGGQAYSGGRGGRAGLTPWSGGGGGGGGATVLIKNNTIIGVAAGGGGAGGGGVRSAGQNSPGSDGFVVVTNGQPGTDKFGDGGGSGGGGGGTAGGVGGGATSGDVGGLAGFYGRNSSGVVVENPNGATPGGTASIYYPGRVSVGGGNNRAGNSGAAVFEFDIPGLYVNTGNLFVPVNDTFVRANNQWNKVKVTRIRQNNAWVPINGSFAPTFDRVPGNFGII
jgi:hypothetical protein